MTAARFREILRTLSWFVPNAAEMLAIEVEPVQRWHDALEPVPNNVARWLQTLAKTHEDHPYPEGWFTDQPAKRAISRAHRLRPATDAAMSSDQFPRPDQVGLPDQLETLVAGERSAVGTHYSRAERGDDCVALRRGWITAFESAAGAQDQCLGHLHPLRLVADIDFACSQREHHITISDARSPAIEATRGAYVSRHRSTRPARDLRRPMRPPCDKRNG